MKELGSILISLWMTIFGGLSPKFAGTTLIPQQGGTGTSTIPTADQILIGGDNNRYDVKTLTAGSNVTIATSSGKVTISSTGTGGSSFAWPFTAATNYVSTTTTLGLLNGFFSTASSTISNSFYLPSLSQGFAYVGSNGLLNTVSTSTALATKQDVLVSGTNIKTINGSSVLGSGDLTVTGSGLASTTPWTAGNLTIVLDNGHITSLASSSIKLSNFTNDAGFLTSLSGAASSTLLGDTNSWSGINRFGFASSTYHSFTTASTTNLLVNGFVGIGTTTATMYSAQNTKLNIQGSTTISTYLGVGYPQKSTMIPNWLADFIHNIDGYASVNFANYSPGVNASTDLTFNTASTTETTYYADIGMNSTNYNVPSYGILNVPSSSYWYNTDGPIQIATATTTSAGYINFITGGTTGFSTGSERLRILANGFMGIGTSTPLHQLTISSTTAPQLSLSAGAGIAQWVFRNAGGNLYLATTTVAGTSTSTPFLSILNSGSLLVGTTTPWLNSAVNIVGTTTIKGQFTTLAASTTAASTQNIDWSLGNTQKIMLTGSTNIVINSTSSNPIDGTTYKLMICQDPTGSRAVTWANPTSLRWWNGTTTITSTANKCTWIGMIYTSTNGNNIYSIIASSTNVDIK